MAEIALLMSRLYVIISLSAVAFKTAQEVLHYLTRISAMQILSSKISDGPDSVTESLDKLAKQILRDNLISAEEVESFAKTAILCYVVNERIMSHYFEDKYNKHNYKYKILIMLAKHVLENKSTSEKIFSEISDINSAVRRKIPLSKIITEKDIQRYAKRLLEKLPDLNSELMDDHLNIIEPNLIQDISQKINNSHKILEFNAV